MSFSLFSCIEGVELEDNPYHRVPDGNVVVEFFSSFNKDWYGLSAQDSAVYRDSLIAWFGPTRVLRIHSLADGSNREIEISTVVAWSQAYFDCDNVDGEAVVLPPGDIELYEVLDNGQELYIDETSVYPNREGCFSTRVPYP